MKRAQLECPLVAISGHQLVRCACLLLTQSDFAPFRSPRKSCYDRWSAADIESAFATMATLGLTVPERVLSLADEVIE